MVDKQISVRLSLELLARLRKACDKERSPYAPTQTAVIERGVELALKELERKGRK